MKVNIDYIEALKQLYNESKKFNIIFLDPPYKTDYAINAIEQIFKYNLLEDDGIIIVETDDENKIDDIKKKNNIEVYDTRKYGIVFIIFIRKG